jgi:hypothetical protein
MRIVLENSNQSENSRNGQVFTGSASFGLVLGELQSLFFILIIKFKRVDDSSITLVAAEYA